jgi:hypothetical protein
MLCHLQGLAAAANKPLVLPALTVPLLLVLLLLLLLLLRWWQRYGLGRPAANHQTRRSAWPWAPAAAVLACCTPWQPLLRC